MASRARGAGSRAGFFVVVALVVAGLLAPALPAHADASHQIAAAKRKVASAQQQLAAIQDRADALSARYVAAQDALAAARSDYAQARARLSAVAGEISGLQRRIGAFAAAAYRGQGNVELAVITSGSPQTLVDELGALGAVSRSEQSAMSQLRYVQAQRRAAQQAAVAALARQRASTTKLAAARKAIEAAGARQLALLHRLQAQEAAIIRAARIAAAKAAAARRAALLRAEREAAARAAARAAALAAQQRATQLAMSTFARTPAAPAVPTGSGGAPVAVHWAFAELGKPYVWAAAGPNTFDCSGLTQYVWGKAGVYLPHYTVSQYDSEPHVSRAQLQPGDLVFFPGSDGTWSAPGHVGIYVGGGMMIDAPYTGADVREEPVWWSQFVGAVRP